MIRERETERGHGRKGERETERVMEGKGEKKRKE